MQGNLEGLNSKFLLIKDKYTLERHRLPLFEHGFTLIELMIVLVIVGILSSFAIPQYTDYITRAKVTELLTVAQSAKLAVSEAMMTGIAKDQIDNAKIGYDIIKDKDKIKELSISKSEITITGDSKALGIDVQKILKIVLKPEDQNGFIHWKCGVDPIEFKKFVPEICRNPI